MSYTKIYQQTQNSGVTNPLEAVAILLDTAVKHVAQARQAIIQGEIERRYLETEKAASLIVGLAANLTNEPKSEAARVLVEEMSAYYSKVVVLLTNINMKNDAVLCEKVIVILKHMSDVWRQASKKSQAEHSDESEEHVNRNV